MRHIGLRLVRVSQRFFVSSRDLKLKLTPANFFECSSRRTLFCETGSWDTPWLTQAARLRIETVWKKKIEQLDKEQKNGKSDGEKYYVLSMFPYPSGKLHMGHVRVYTIGDAIGRYHRLQGRNVIHPIGWDSFGLPAENAAKQQGVNPTNWTRENIEVMREQLSWLCVNFDWDREISTCDPRYYKWTQWIFCQLMKRGLAYQQEAMVNWDPVDETVLAAEQVDKDGRSWRSGAKVEKKPLLQWYIKTTAYAQELHDSLDVIAKDWIGKIGALQKWWIGKPVGTRVNLPLFKSDGSEDGSISVHVARPEALFGAAFLVLSSANFDVIKRAGKEMPTTLEIPLSGARVPVIISDEYPFRDRFKGERVIPDAILGCPALCSEDKAFAEERNIPYKQQLFKGSGATATLNDCHPTIDGMNRRDGVEEILRQLVACGNGGTPASPFLTDWLISRQRYWGTPIPAIHCSDCGVVPVPEDQLPVVLPEDVNFEEANRLGSPLCAAPHDWLYVECPQCGKDGAKRETDTMDTFVDSSWYYLRYLDPNNDVKICDTDKASRGLPVDIYIGGKEHAILHLFYARFMHRFLREIGIVDKRHPEPFVKLLPQGMVTGQSFKIKATGQYVHPKEAELDDDQKMVYRHRETGELLESKYEKMSKSKFNGVDPQECVEMWGCDTTRLCMFSNKPPDHDRPWSLTEGVFKGTINWQRRLWATVTFYLRERASLPPQFSPDEQNLDDAKMEKEIDRVRNQMIITFEESVEFEMNQAMKAFHILTNVLKKLEKNKEWAVSLAFEKAMADMIIMIFPFAPMFSAEMWQGFASASWHYPQLDARYDWAKDVWEQKWPRVDDEHDLPIWVALNGDPISCLSLPKRDFERVSADNIESILLKHLSPDDRFAAKCNGSSVRAFEGVTFASPKRYAAEVNIIMNSIPTIDADQSTEGSEDEREQSKKKVRNEVFNIPIQLS